MAKVCEKQKKGIFLMKQLLTTFCGKGRGMEGVGIDGAGEDGVEVNGAGTHCQLL